MIFSASKDLLDSQVTYKLYIFSYGGVSFIQRCTYYRCNGETLVQILSIPEPTKCFASLIGERVKKKLNQSLYGWAPRPAAVNNGIK